MAAKRKLHLLTETLKSIKRGVSLSGSSGAGREVLGNLPYITQALAFSEAWHAPDGGQLLDTPLDDQGSTETSNLLRKYFDKNTEGPGIWKWLHYFDIYQRHLQKFVGREVHIVEVGIYSGGSLPMWHHYFGSRCHVYAVDIEPACKAYESDGTKVFIGDQADRNFWEEFRSQVPVVDILIDDGGHHPTQQIVTLEEMLPHLSQGGVFLCEDVHGIQNPFSAFVYGLIDSLNTMGQVGFEPARVKSSGFQRAIHSIHSYPFVTVIEKNERPEEQLVAPKQGTEWQPFL